MCGSRADRPRWTNTDPGTRSAEHTPVQSVDPAGRPLEFHGGAQPHGLSSNLQRDGARERHPDLGREPVVHATKRMLTSPEPGNVPHGHECRLIVDSYV